MVTRKFQLFLQAVLDFDTQDFLSVTFMAYRYAIQTRWFEVIFVMSITSWTVATMEANVGKPAKWTETSSIILG